MPTINYITLVDKAMRVLESLRGKREAPLGQISTSTGLTKNSVFRILFTFERLGYVEKSARGRYSLAPQLARLANDARVASDLGNLAEPFLADLLGRFRETVNLAVLDDGEALFIRVRESSHEFRLANHVGMRTPVHSTALGKCLLCCLPREEIDTILKKHPLRVRTLRTIRDRHTFYRELAAVRSRGYAIDNQEYSRGARCVAAPIHNSAGDVCAAISIAGPAARMIPQRDREIAEALMETCGKIARLIGYTKSTQEGPENPG